MNNIPLVQVKTLHKTYQSSKGVLHALNGISLFVQKNETLGLVGESGCGKSTLGRCLLGLEPPSKGSVLYDSIDLTKCSSKKWKELRKEMQMIFQDPYASLNPRMRVGKSIEEAMIIHKIGTKFERKRHVDHLLDQVGLDPQSQRRFPHEFSGGQLQRIGIARALAVEPSFLVLDEPLSALDVSIQAQIINLLKDLQKKLQLTYVIIAHDLAVVKYLSDRVGVMYLGELMELASSKELYTNPLHPYTNALLSAIPQIGVQETTKKRIILKGELPSPIDPPKGCPFASRCPQVMPICHTKKPLPKEISKGHKVACHLF